MSILTLDQVLARPRRSPEVGRLSASRDGKGLLSVLVRGLKAAWEGASRAACRMMIRYQVPREVQASLILDRVMTG